MSVGGSHAVSSNFVSPQIDPPTVKWLDRNLFIGEEIKEVYEEITKTIRTDHLLYDQVRQHRTEHAKWFEPNK